MEKLLHYKDIVLADPVYSEVRSRDDISSNVEFLGREFKSCAIPANMKSCISFDKAEELSQNGFFYILHRFYDYEDILKWIQTNQNYLRTISISVGVKQKDYDLIDKLEGHRVHFVTVDIAFGHSVLMKEMISHIKNRLPNTKIIAGNVCTAEAVKDLVNWGASSVKVGLSCGKACSTYNVTGVGSPMFSTTLECSKAYRSVDTPCYNNGNHDYVEKQRALQERVKNTPIIADGGIREVGHVCKALVGGATMVMMGSQFCACIDSPAENIETFVHKELPYGAAIGRKEVTHKLYFGSASAKNKGSNSYIEGSSNVELPVNPQTYLEYFETVNQGVRSCMSYHNLRDIKSMRTIDWSIHNM